MQRASVGAYLEAWLIWHMYEHAASTLFILRGEALALAAYIVFTLHYEWKELSSQLRIRPNWLIYQLYPLKFNALRINHKSFPAHEREGNLYHADRADRRYPWSPMHRDLPYLANGRSQHQSGCISSCDC